MHKPLFNHVAILGFGLIGSSIARTVIKHKLAEHISAFDTSDDTLTFAREHKLADSHFAHAGQAVAGADLIIFASPPSYFEALAKDIAPFIKEGAIVMDVASVKRQAIAFIAPHIPKHAFFVPAHPIAGSEKSGVEAGNADLFSGKKVILTPEEKDVKSDAVTQVRTFWEKMGAKIDYMPALLHDRIYAYVSHLPQLVAYAVWHCLKELRGNDDKTFARFIRLSHSDPALWADISIANADFIEEALADFTIFATQMAGELSEETESGNGNAQMAIDLFPKVVGTCLVATVSVLQEKTGIHPVHYAGAGFSDMVAPAVSDPHAAMAAISEHHRHIARILKDTIARLQTIRDAMIAHDQKRLTVLFGAN